MALGLTACGANKTVDFSADPSAQLQGTLQNDPNNILAYCNMFNSPNMSGRAKVYTNEYGFVLADTVEVYFDTTVDQVLSGGNVLKIYKWYVRPDGTTYISPTTAKIIIKDLQTGRMITGQWSEISQAMVDEYTRTYYLPQMTVGQFLQGKSLVISGIEMEYDVLRFSVQSGSSQIASVDTLIPAFSANPTKYAATHGPILQALHPNNSVINMGFGDAQYAQRLNNYCF